MNVFNLISAGGGSGSGLYIWKKNEVTPSTYVSHFLSAGDNAVDAYLPISTSYTVYEWNSIEPNADGSVKGVGLNATIPVTASSGGYYLQYGKYYTIEGATTGEAFATTNPYSADQTYISRNANNGRLWFGAGGISTTKPINYYSSQNAYTFIDYVISDDENAYPSAGTQGGYYYERYTPLSADLFNCTKYITGSYTMTSTLSVIEVTHNLGVVPKVAYIWTDTVSSQTRRQAIVVKSANGYTFYGEYYGTGVSYTAYGGGMTASNTVFGFYSDNFFKSGATYNYIIFA